MWAEGFVACDFTNNSVPVPSEDSLFHLYCFFVQRSSHIVHVHHCCQLKHRLLEVGSCILFYYPQVLFQFPNISQITSTCFFLSMFGFVLYENLRSIKFLQQLKFLLKVVLGILSYTRTGINIVAFWSFVSLGASSQLNYSESVAERFHLTVK